MNLHGCIRAHNDNVDVKFSFILCLIFYDKLLFYPKIDVYMLYMNLV